MARTATTRAATVLLLHGEERFLIDELARTTLDSWKADLVSDFGFETPQGTGPAAPRRRAAPRLQGGILQPPFLGPYRVVFVRMLPAMRAEGVAGALTEIPSSTRML